jgi:hypothetical protein
VAQVAVTVPLVVIVPFAAKVTLFDLDRSRRRTPLAMKGELVARVMLAQVIRATISWGPPVAAMKAVQGMLVARKWFSEPELGWSDEGY